MLKSAGVTEVVEDIESVPKNCSILLLRADFLFEDRVINYMVRPLGTRTWNRIAGKCRISDEPCVVGHFNRLYCGAIG